MPAAIFLPKSRTVTESEIAHDEVHVVLDEEHGQVVALARARDELGERLDLLVAEAARRLVEQQEARLRDERPGELDALARRVRQPGDGPFRESLELEVLEDLAQPRPCGAPRVRSDEDVVANGHRREELDVLERAGDPAPDDPVRRRVEEALAVERDLAGRPACRAA